jgi:hypothetical protein
MSDPVAPPRSRSRGKLIAAIVVALLLLYGASPYYSVWRFSEAIRAHDMAALAARVDFPAVRGALRQQLRDKLFGSLTEKQRERLQRFISTSANDPLDQLIEAYVTPEGLASLISNPDPLRNANSVSSIPNLDGSGKPIDWSKFRNAFFTGPRDFAVDHESIKLRFRYNGLGWKLHAVDLQLSPPKR